MSKGGTYESNTSGDDHAESGRAVDGGSAGEDWGASWLRTGADTSGANAGAGGSWVARWAASWHDAAWGWWCNGRLALVDGDGAGNFVRVHR